MVRRYLAGESSNEIGHDMGFSGVAVCKILERHGIERRSQSIAQRKCRLRRDAFDEITEESAYWVGFIMADGTVIQRKDGSPEIAVVLAERDHGHLMKLRDFLGSTHKIIAVDHRGDDSYSRASVSYRFAVRSKQIASDLARYGVTPNKTHDAEVKLLENNRHFWRGVVDGDGWVKLSGPTSRIDVVGSHRLMRQFATFVNAECGTTLTARRHKSIWRVSTGRNSARRVIKMLYENASVALARKNAAKNIRTVGLAGVADATMTLEGTVRPGLDLVSNGRDPAKE